MLRDYQPQYVSFAFNATLDGGAVGAIPMAAFVAGNAALNFITLTTTVELAGIGSSITVSLEPSGQVVASIPFLPSALNQVNTFSTSYIRNAAVQELTVNIIGAPLTGAFVFYGPLAPLQE